MAQVDLRGGRFKRYRDLRLRLDAGYAGDVAKGTLAASGLNVGLTGSFDVPVKALKQGRRVPVKVELELPELRLDESLRELGLETSVSGLVSAQVSVSGDSGRPPPPRRTQGAPAPGKQLAPSDVDVAVESADAGRLRARADLALEGGKSFVEVRTPSRSVNSSASGPAGSAQLGRVRPSTPTSENLPLKLLSEAGIGTQLLDGTLERAGARNRLRHRSPWRAVREREGVAIRGREPWTPGRPALGRRRAPCRRPGRAGREAPGDGQGRVGASPKELKDPAAWRSRRSQSRRTSARCPFPELQAAMQLMDVDPAQTPPQIRGTLAGGSR